MSQELIYTSAPRGLKAGSRGFCTVAETPGMPKTLADRLESLSGYRHLHPPQSPQAALNPVAYAFYKTSLGGRVYFILSRVADAGVDYSQRTNKLAHHLVLDPHELAPAGPAWMLSQPGVMETSWSGDPRPLPPRSIPQGDLAPQVCTAWQRVTGDAGWGGVLAQTAAEGREAYLIVPAGLNLLPLLVEAQALLPVAKRWEATFSTYYTKATPGVDCRWRCLIEGTPEAATLRPPPGATVLDLTRPLASAPDTPWVQAARTGAPPADLQPPILEVVEDSLPNARPYGSPVTGHGPAFPPGESDPELRLAPPPLIPPSGRRPTGRRKSESPSHAANNGSRTGVKLFLIASCVGLVSFFLGYASAYYRHKGQPSEPTQQEVANIDTGAENPGNDSEDANASSAANSAAVHDLNANVDPSSIAPSANAADSASNQAPPNTPTEPPAEQNNADVRDASRTETGSDHSLSLEADTSTPANPSAKPKTPDSPPAAKSSTANANKSSHADGELKIDLVTDIDLANDPQPIFLGKIQGNVEDRLQFTLLGLPHGNDGNPIYKLVLDSSSGKELHWKIMYGSDSVGTLKLENEHLYLSVPDSRYTNLEKSFLEVEAIDSTKSSQTHYVSLHPLDLSPEPKKVGEDLELREDFQNLRWNEYLDERLKLELIVSYESGGSITACPRQFVDLANSKRSPPLFDLSPGVQCECAFFKFKGNLRFELSILIDGKKPDYYLKASRGKPSKLDEIKKQLDKEELCQKNIDNKKMELDEARDDETKARLREEINRLENELEEKKRKFDQDMPWGRNVPALVDTFRNADIHIRVWRQFPGEPKKRVPIYTAGEF